MQHAQVFTLMHADQGRWLSSVERERGYNGTAIASLMEAAGIDPHLHGYLTVQWCHQWWCIEPATGLHSTWAFMAHQSQLYRQSISKWLGISIVIPYSEPLLTSSMLCSKNLVRTQSCLRSKLAICPARQYKSPAWAPELLGPKWLSGTASGLSIARPQDRYSARPDFLTFFPGEKK